MAQITCRDLTLGYETGVVAEHISFSVEEGDYLCIVGENGSGKSTLMKTLLGLTPPLGGSIETGDGLRLTEIGYLPQQTLVQRGFPASVREIVQSGCQARKGLRPFYNKEEKELAMDAMERMGIRPIANHCYRELSGGQQQRVLLARALCAARKILLLDEPAAGLDPQSREDILNMIVQLHQSGSTVVMVSHAMDDILQLADEMFVLQEGKITASGSPLEVFKRWDILAEAGLEPPELLMLLEQLQGAGLAADMPVRTLKDAVKAVERGLRHAK